MRSPPFELEVLEGALIGATGRSRVSLIATFFMYGTLVGIWFQSLEIAIPNAGMLTSGWRTPPTSIKTLNFKSVFRTTQKSVYSV